MQHMRVWILMAGLTALFVVLGRLVAGQAGMRLFFLLALAMNALTYYYSDALALRMTGSEPLSEAEAPELYAMIRRLAQRAGLPMPRVYRTPSPQPNAFATGRDPEHAAVAVTDGLLRLLDREEVEGVLAHELAHVKNRDTLVGAMAATLAGAIGMLADAARWSLMFGGFGHRDERQEGAGSALGAIVALLLAPLAATLVQLAISRSREFLADETGARIAGSPYGLASALEKLERAAHALPMEVNPGTAHLFIVNPLRGDWLLTLFSTHPPIAERVRRLRNMRFAHV